MRRIKIPLPLASSGLVLAILCNLADSIILARERGLNNRPNKQNHMLLDVVRLVAWHEPFTETRRSVAVHADAVFQNANFGGEKQSDITFTLTVEKAEIVILVPDTEPAKIRWESIELFDSDIGRSEKLRGSFCVEQSSDQRKNESIWGVQNFDKGGLIGRAWNPQTTPLLKIQNGSPNPNDTLPPVISVEVRCLGQDLNISNIKIKDTTKFKNAHGGTRNKHRQAAAEAYIRSQLVAENLPPEGVGEVNSTVLIASITAEAKIDD